MNSIEPAPRIPLNWWGITLRIIVATVLLFAANFARAPLHQVVAEQLADDEVVYLIVDTLVFFLTAVLVIAGVMLWFRVIEGASIRVTGLFDLHRILPGVLGGTGLVAVATVVAWAVLVAAGQRLGELPAGDAGEAGATAAMALIFYVLVRAFILQGLPEELLYRGWFFALTRHRPWLTFWWTTVAFTVIHLVSSGGQQSAVDHLYYLALPLGMGMLAGAVVLWRGSMWWAVGTHGGMHVCLPIAMLVVPVPQGPVVWLIYGAAQAATGAVVLVLWHRNSQSPARS